MGFNVRKIGQMYNEVLHVAEYVDLATIRNLMLTCKAFHQNLNVDSIWKTLYRYCTTDIDDIFLFVVVDPSPDRYEEICFESSLRLHPVSWKERFFDWQCIKTSRVGTLLSIVPTTKSLLTPQQIKYSPEVTEEACSYASILKSGSITHSLPTFVNNYHSFIVNNKHVSLNFTVAAQPTQCHGRIFVYSSKSKMSFDYVSKFLASSCHVKSNIDPVVYVPSGYELGNFTQYFKCDNCGTGIKSTSKHIKNLLNPDDYRKAILCSTTCSSKFNKATFYVPVMLIALHDNSKSDYDKSLVELGLDLAKQHDIPFFECDLTSGKNIYHSCAAIAHYCAPVLVQMDKQIVEFEEYKKSTSKGNKNSKSCITM